MGGGKRSRTAQGVVAERALLTDLGVIDDPHAVTMLEPAFARLVAVLRRLPRATWRRAITLAGLGARVAWFDARIVAALDDGIDQVAIIGAGFDSRAWRLARSGARFFELDQPASQAAKGEVAPGPGPTYVAADLRAADAAEALVAAGLDPSRPAVVVMEGVTMYLDEDVVRRQLAGLAAACAPGSVLLADFTPPPGTGSAGNARQLWLQRLARGGSGERFLLTIDAEAARRLVEGSGWGSASVTSLRDAALALVDRSLLPCAGVNPGKTLVFARR